MDSTKKAHLQKMLDKQLHDYFKQKGLHVTAEMFKQETNIIPDEDDTSSGFLQDWWSIFYDTYTSRDNQQSNTAVSTNHCQDVTDQNMLSLAHAQLLNEEKNQHASGSSSAILHGLLSLPPLNLNLNIPEAAIEISRIMEDRERNNQMLNSPEDMMRITPAKPKGSRQGLPPYEGPSN